jgi:hypothetical protein
MQDKKTRDHAGDGGDGGRQPVQPEPQKLFSITCGSISLGAVVSFIISKRVGVEAVPQAVLEL